MANVLIVEDELEIADTLRFALDAEGYTSLWASTAGEARNHLSGGQADFIILDVGLPDSNGFELLKEIRQSSELPVMMLTARSDEVDRIVGLEIGADDYVTKPFSPREVVARVKAILKRTQSEPSASTQTFELDLQGMQIKYHGSLLSLTKSEFYLLQSLLDRPGQILSRRQLINRVWSDHHPSDDRSIDTHVKALRAKLKEIQNSDSPIVTHRGFGYSIQL